MIFQQIKSILYDIKDLIEPRKFDEEGYDDNGMDKYFFDKKGVHFSGQNRDFKGYDRRGFDKNSVHRTGTLYDFEGYDISGYDEEGYDINGYDKDLYSKYGFHKKTRLHKNGTKYDDNGFDVTGYDEKGYDINGYDKDLYSKCGFHKKTRLHKNGTKYDDDQFDFFDVDNNGYNRSGVKNNDYWWKSSDKKLLRLNSFDKFIKYDQKVIPKYTDSSGFIDNPFNVLGLKTSSTITDINKRGAEIQKLLTINHNPDYDYDILHTIVSRDPMSVKNSIQALQQANKKVVNSFLWFQLDNPIDEEAFGYLNVNKFYSAIYMWHKDYICNGNHTSFKNLVIAETILFALTGDLLLLDYMIDDWKNLLDTPETWESFKTYYSKYDLFKVKDDFFEGFGNKVTNILIDYFYELSKKHNNTEINILVYKKFAKYSDSFYKDIVVPTLTKLKDVTKFIKSNDKWINLKDKNESRSINSTDKKNIVDNIKIINTEFGKLYTYDILKNSDVISVIDDLSSAIRSSAIYIHNNSSNKKDKEIVNDLLNLGQEIAQSDVIKSRIKNDIVELKEITEQNELSDKIFNLIKQNNFGKAKNLLNEYRKKNESAGAIKYYHEMWESCDIAMAWDDFNKVTKEIENAINYGYGKTEVRRIVKIAIERIDKLRAMNISNADKRQLLETRVTLQNAINGFRLF